MGAALMVRGSFDPKARAVRVRFPRHGGHITFDVPAFPGDPPCNVFLEVGEDGRVVGASFAAASPPSQGQAGALPLRIALPLRVRDDGSAELLIDETVAATGGLPFDSPGDELRWFAEAAADDQSRIRSITFARLGEVLTRGTVRAFGLSVDG